MKIKNNNNSEYFDFVEFILQKDGNELSIITSAYSKDGNFLLNKVKTKKERLEENFCKNDYISASKIREAIKQDKLDDVLSSLPESTKKFLSSEDSKEIRLKIKQGNSRH